MSSTEPFLQVVWGKPETVYTGLFADRTNFLSVPWVRQLEWVKTSAGQTVNSCQKPKRFYIDYLSSLSNVGLVFDLFAGTGTASSVALQNGIDFVAIEKDDEQFRFLKKRLVEQGKCRISITEEIPELLPKIIWNEPGGT